jgi:hypothetical protein
LEQAGRREIGGILMGEHVDPDTFRVMDLTVQREGGTFAAFLRLIDEILAPLREFFEKTRHEYTRFNYMGEWHSHHSFALSPSVPDHEAMYDIATDPQVGAHFVVLLLVKLGDRGQLESSLTVYQTDRTPFRGAVVLERPL